MENQSKNAITFDTQLETTLKNLFSFFSNLLSVVFCIRLCRFAPQCMNDAGVYNNHECDGEKSHEKKPNQAVSFAHPFLGPHKLA